MTSSAGLGDRVSDKVTGFIGIVIAVASYLFGTDRVLVQAEEINSEGRIVELWFDTSAVVILEVEAVLA